MKCETADALVEFIAAVHENSLMLTKETFRGADFETNQYVAAQSERLRNACERLKEAIAKEA